MFKESFQKKSRARFAGLRSGSQIADIARVRGHLRWIVVAVAIVGASLLALGAQATTWWSIGETRIGLLSTEMCIGDGCRRSDLGWAGSPTWARAGAATYAAGLAAAAALIALAGAAAAGRRGRGIALLSASAAVTCAAATAVFMGSRPALDLVLQRGPWVFAGGIVSAAVAAGLVLRRPRDSQP